MNIIDISWPITPNMTSYKNNKPIDLKYIKKYDVDGVRDSVISMNMHTGTHIDAPSHFIKDGITIEQMSLTSLIGPCRVLDMTHLEDRITKNNLTIHHLAAGEIILLKTKNSSLANDAEFNPNFIYLDHTGASYLALQGIKAVGIDYLGIERQQPHHETHKILFDHNIGILEGIRLAHVTPGHYQLICLPLALHTTEAAPARAVLHII